MKRLIITAIATLGLTFGVAGVAAAGTHPSGCTNPHGCPTPKPPKG